jgi:hypothetical protein
MQEKLNREEGGKISVMTISREGNPFGPRVIDRPTGGQIFRRGLIGRNFNKSDEVLRQIRPKVRRE